MIRIESPDLNRLAIGAKAFPKPLRAAIRKEFASTAKEAASEVQSKILDMPVKGDRPWWGGTSLRRDVADAVRVNPSVTASRGANVRIRVARTPSLAAHNRARVAQLLDSGKKFRHPIFGEWVEGGSHDQQPYPFFKVTIEKRAPALRLGMERALTEATRLTMPNVRP